MFTKSRPRKWAARGQSCREGGSMKSTLERKGAHRHRPKYHYINWKCIGLVKKDPAEVIGLNPRYSNRWWFWVFESPESGNKIDVPWQEDDGVKIGVSYDLTERMLNGQADGYGIRPHLPYPLDVEPHADVYGQPSVRVVARHPNRHPIPFPSKIQHQT